jgi:undecaprenyl diphosphate synthase
VSYPDHIAIIMDGNGRWAKAKGNNRLYGHVRGARVAKKIIEHCSRINIKTLTLFAFSTENWFRPKEEVNFLMRLLSRHLRREKHNLVKNNIRFHCIGNFNRLPKEVHSIVLETIEETRNNTGLNLVFALSYGGRQEILQATQKICEQVKSGILEPDQVTEEVFCQALDSSFLPDPDLIIRTSGEYRISNFFLWQAAYSELFILEKMWPDFSTNDLDQALKLFASRQRRFGRVHQTDETHLEPASPS